MLGLIVGFLAITVTTPIAPQLNIEELAQVDNSSTEEEQQPEASLKAFDAIPATAHTSLTHEFLLIDILPSFESLEEDLATGEEAVCAASKVLKILFRRIISPNAP
ncbi:hypothetical protein [Marinoscillum sp.]|uniref:hypothetical protein n=1 Tax=Marinoscillum sp. TaxID=2024838 RepID=UPI003BA90CB1